MPDPAQMMPRNSALWNQARACEVNLVRLSRFGQPPIQAGRVGFGGQFGVELASLWALVDWWTTAEMRCKDFKKLDKIDRDG